MNESIHWYENEDQVKHVSRCMRERPFEQKQ